LKKHILSIFLLYIFNVSYSQNDISFLQKDKNKINVRYTNNFESLEVKNFKTGKTQIVKNIEASITGKDSHLEANDYNFDGFTDFASFHTDDGMGVYSIYQIFIFNPKTQQFDLLEFPTNFKSKCDIFCDVKIDKTKKTLISSCRGGARTHNNIWKYDRNKKLILSKTESY
jgi:hypothetical protein